MIFINQQPPYITYGEMNLKNDIRFIMTQFAYLSRSYITAAFSGYGNAAAIANKLYEMPLKVQSKMEFIFGLPPGEELVNLLSMHTVHMQTLINAMYYNDQANIDESVKQLYQNADDVAAYYAKINPFWDETKWKNLLYTYLKTLIEETVALLMGEFEKELDIFDRILMDALNIGEYLAGGILQFLSVSKSKQLQPDAGAYITNSLCITAKP